MAVATSHLHRSIKGAIGDFIFRTYNGKTIVSLRPVYKNETNTEARLKTRNRFRDASYYASNAMEDVKRKTYYTQKAKQLKLPNAYTAALTEYLRKAKAGVVVQTSFAAKKDDKVRIVVRKSVFKINKITVQACNTKGEVVTEQKLSKGSTHNSFLLILPEDIPDFGGLNIITDEPQDTAYTVMRSQFIEAVFT